MREYKSNLTWSLYRKHLPKHTPYMFRGEIFINLECDAVSHRVAADRVDCPCIIEQYDDGAVTYGWSTYYIARLDGLDAVVLDSAGWTLIDEYEHRCRIHGLRVLGQDRGRCPYPFMTMKTERAG